MQNDPIAPVVTFTASGGTGPYVFTYSIAVDGGPATVYMTSPGPNIVTIAQSNSVLGLFTYRLLGVTDGNNCMGSVISNPPVAVIQITNGVVPDIAPSIARPLNGIFEVNQSKEGYVQFTNGGSVATAGPMTFRIFKPANFNLSILETMDIVDAIPVDNSAWNITWSPTFGGHYIITSKETTPNIGVGENVKIGFVITATGPGFSTGNIGADVYPASGGDNNPGNNTAIRQFVIN
jgi:hypothetical protein